MIIKNLGGSAKPNLYAEKLYTLLAATLLILFLLAIVLFTPANALVCEILYKATWTQYSEASAKGDILAHLLPDFLKNIEGENSDISADSFLLGLSYPMIKLANANQKTDTPNYQDTFSDSVQNREKSEYMDKNIGSSAYKDMPIASDEPILSIYEHYENSSGAKIEEVTADIDGIERKIPPDTFRITPLNFSGQKTSIPQLLISNQTSFNIDLNDFIKLKYPIRDADITSDEPVILILCTHATESYCETGTFYYAPAFTAERTSDTNKNVILIASELKNTLENNGIPVIQSLKLHDEVSYQNSYMRSLETMNAYLKEYPSIKYVIDVHRDSSIANTGEKYKPTIRINGKNAAQIMMVIGTSDGGAEHPNWTDNLTFATYMQQALNEKYPMLARPINLRTARFNQHVTRGSIILEIGSCGSSFDEALYSARLFGECLAELIKENSE